VVILGHKVVLPICLAVAVMVAAAPAAGLHLLAEVLVTSVDIWGLFIGPSDCWLLCRIVLFGGYQAHLDFW
jgi:hypothetical protein